MIVHVRLTAAQKAQLAPLFVAIRKSGGNDAILGQVFEDGIAARIVENNKVMKVQKALIGRTSTQHATSATQQMVE